MIASHTSLVDACACGQVGVVTFLIDLDTTDLDTHGPDGMSALCVAATWGYDEIVRLLLEAGCDPNLRNLDGGQSTALHAAACQEYGKIALLLLQSGANPTLEDSDGRTACDYASVSDGLWPLFASRGLPRTPKDVLIAKRVIYKVDPAASQEYADATDATDGKALDAGGGGEGGEGGGHAPSTLAFYSRPGSAYVRSDLQSFGGSGAGGSSGGGSGSGASCSSGGGGGHSSTLPRVPEQIGGLALDESIDPLEHLDLAAPPDGAPSLNFWRDG